MLHVLTYNTIRIYIVVLQVTHITLIWCVYVVLMLLDTTLTLCACCVPIYTALCNVMFSPYKKGCVHCNCIEKGGSSDGICSCAVQ